MWTLCPRSLYKKRGKEELITHRLGFTRTTSLQRVLALLDHDPSLTLFMKWESSDSFDLCKDWQKERGERELFGRSKMKKMHIQDLQVVWMEGCKSNTFLILALGLIMR